MLGSTRFATVGRKYMVGRIKVKIYATTTGRTDARLACRLPIPSEI
jgi:hypothetical protein